MTPPITGPEPTATIVARAELPTPWGTFQIVGFDCSDGKEHVALVRREVEPVPGESALVRIHSQCLTGDLFFSARCDCRAQLEAALEQLAGTSWGILVYLRQEGRGIGLTNKIRAYALQDQGADTVDANLALGFAADARDYGVAAAILTALGVRRLRLLSNNPEKAAGLTARGLEVELLPLEVAATPSTRAYLETKRDRLGHRIKGGGSGSS
jgi:GTP cyclohydrolase II